MDQRQLFQFQSHQHFFGEGGSAHWQQLSFGLEGKKTLLQLLLSRPLMVLKAKLELEAGNETIFQPAAAFGSNPQTPGSQIAKRPSWRSGMHWLEELLAQVGKWYDGASLASGLSAKLFVILLPLLVASSNGHWPEHPGSGSIDLIFEHWPADCACDRRDPCSR